MIVIISEPPFEIMSPRHPRLQEFTEKLSDALIVSHTPNIKLRCDGRKQSAGKHHFRYTKIFCGRWAARSTSRKR
jgi:hypothetical protein